MIAYFLLLCTAHSDSDNLLLLMEIFPDCAKSDIIKSLKNSNGDLDSCIHSLLENCDQPSRNRQETLLEKEAHASDKKRDLSCVKDDTHLKNTILSKYASLVVASNSYYVHDIVVFPPSIPHAHLSTHAHFAHPQVCVC